MPHRLKQRQHKIQEKRKQTPWREFILDLLSYYNVSLYKKDGMISAISPEHRFKIVNPIEFESQRDDYLKFGLEVSQLSFFEQFGTLAEKISFPSLALWGNNTNTGFSHKIVDSNNCYISFEITYSENIAYSINVKDKCHDIYESMQVGDASSVIYSSVCVFQSAFIFYSEFIFNSRDIRFSTNMQGCIDCIFCNDLQNKSYCIRNEQHTKEEYLELKEEILSKKNEFANNKKNNISGNRQLFCENTQGTFTIKCNDLNDGYYTYNINKGNNAMFAGTAEGNQHFFDVVSAGSPRGDDFYAVAGAGMCYHVYCSTEIIGGTNVLYSKRLENSSYCLGCIGLKNKSYCIFNKQYEKEERYDKVDDIFTQMEQDGTLGNFFPGSMNPFYFNDTAAYLIDDSFTKEEVEAKGYLRRDEKIAVDIPEGMEVVKTSELGRFEGWKLEDGSIVTSDKSPPTPLSQGGSTNASWWIDPEILKKVIQDEEGNVYRIVKMEYDFLMKHGLPLPRLHWLDRLKMNFKM